MSAYRAAWVVPIDRAPIRHGVVTVEQGRITHVGAEGQGPVQDLGHVALMPGLVNAHTHLELSWMRGRVPKASAFTDWVKGMFAVRGRPDAGMTDAQVAAIHDGIAESRAAGTVAVGDISNSLASAAPLDRSGVAGVVFHELLGFKERDGALIERTRDARSAAMASGMRVSLAPHAPYSTSLELFQAIREAVSASDCPVMSVHLGESPEESELLRSGTGPWRGMLEMIGAWRDDWRIPGCDPVSYLDQHHLLDAQTLVAHGVQFDDAALGRLAAIGATLVTCPRSNHWVGVGYPPLERFYASGVRVAVGTDSLASVEDLNVFSELKTMRWLAPGVAASRLLWSGTQAGADALGLGQELGSLTPGKRAAMLAVAVPLDVSDVEEYLLSGIEPSQIQWVA